jgi:uncharacterized membrane protein
MESLSTPDLLAVGFFILAWAAYAITLELTPHGRNSLSAHMNRYREIWIQRTLDREMRMVDMQVMAALQNGTAFFASTTLIAIGASLTLLRSTDELLSVVSVLPIGTKPARMLWEIKSIGLTVIFVYAFFKFAWSYRLFNYVAILLGAMPFPADRDSEDARTHVLRTAKVFQSAGRHFNRGQRAFFMALGYLGWFAGPWVLFATTTAVVFVLWRRQFDSEAQRAMAE